MMNEMKTRSEMSEVRRAAVMEATSSLLDEVGVSALTVRQVAERAGVAQGTIFMYADNKSDLVNKVFGLRIAKKWHKLLDDLAGHPPLERVEEFYLGCVDIFYSDLENVQAFYREMARNDSEQLESVVSLLGRLRELLALAKESGSLRPDVDVEVLNYSYQGLYSNIIGLAGEARDHAATRRIIRESMRQLRNGVAG